jgi:hypothetical protein
VRGAAFLLEAAGVDQAAGRFGLPARRSRLTGLDAWPFLGNDPVDIQIYTPPAVAANQHVEAIK